MTLVILSATAPKEHEQAHTQRCREIALAARGGDVRTQVNNEQANREVRTLHVFLFVIHLLFF
jgi:hypothetical protein